jgi:cyclopropane fatty-acyl-phospholipid synthase-like methyltransferase
LQEKQQIEKEENPMKESGKSFFDRIDDISSHYREAQLLFTANRLGVFSALGTRTMSADELAQALDADTRGVRILCDGLVAVSLLTKEQGSYRNYPEALEYLVPHTAKSRTAILRHTAGLYERWAKLHESVKTGQPLPDKQINNTAVSDKRDFAAAMADVARATATKVAEKLDLSSVKTLLDVGGGPGIYAIEFARRFPDLQAVVLDEEETLRVARENIARANLGKRISLKGGDVFQMEIGGSYDFIFLSNFVHIFSYQENKTLVSKCAGALASGGRLCIKDFLLEDDRTTPQGAALFAVNMLMSTQQGDCYTVGEVREWLETAGLTFECLTDLTPQTRLITARKTMEQRT